MNPKKTDGDQAWHITSIHAILAILTHRPLHAISLHASKTIRTQAGSTWKHLWDQAEQLGIPIQAAAAGSGTEIFLRCKPWGLLPERAFWELPDPAVPPAYLLLDQITDPHNFGACLRAAEGAGVHAVVVPAHDRAPLTPVVIHASSGAAASIPCFEVTNFSRFIDQLKHEKNCWVFGADLNGTTELYALDATIPVAWVMGSEGKGLRPLTRTCCDQLFYIPMRGHVQSLNVSVATGITLFEMQRQRHPVKK